MVIEIVYLSLQVRHSGAHGRDMSRWLYPGPSSWLKQNKFLLVFLPPSFPYYPPPPTLFRYQLAKEILAKAQIVKVIQRTKKAQTLVKFIQSYKIYITIGEAYYVLMTIFTPAD